MFVWEAVLVLDWLVLVVSQVSKTQKSELADWGDFFQGSFLVFVML